MPESAFAGDRLAKVIARAGLCSRRDAENWIREGRVSVNGKPIRTPAFNVTDKDRIAVDGAPLASRQGTRVWLYHKPAGLVVTEKDPEGRETIFDTLESHGLPRVVSIGRLDINTEGLLLLTNDGGLKRVLELPATGWLRRYRVRAFGTITQPQLDALKDGIEIDGVQYGPIEALLEREQGSNVWMVFSLREGKNREVKNVLAALGLQVNRLIRVSFGPFQLGELPIGAVEVVKARILREQLGKRLADEAGVDFDSELPEPQAVKLARVAANPKLRVAGPGKEPPPQRKSVAANNERFHFTDRAERGPRDKRDEDRPPPKHRPGGHTIERRSAKKEEAADTGPARQIHFEDGREAAEFVEKLYGKKPPRVPKPEGGKLDGGKPAFRAGGKPPFKSAGDRPPFKKSFDKPRDGDDRPKRPYTGRPAATTRPDGPVRSYADRPKRDFSDKPKRDYSDRPKGDFGDRPKRPYSPRPGNDAPDRPKRAYAPRPAGDGAERPKRPYTGRPAADGAERPKRSYGDKPRSFGDKPKSFGDKPAGAKRSFGDKPRGPRPTGAAARVSRGPKPGGKPSGKPRPPRS